MLQTDKFTLQELKEFDKELFLAINQLTKYMATNFGFKLGRITRHYDPNDYSNYDEFSFFYSFTIGSDFCKGYFDIDLNTDSLRVSARSHSVDIPLRNFGDIFKAKNLFLIYLSLRDGEDIPIEHIEKLNPSCAQKLKAKYDFSEYYSKTKTSRSSFSFMRDADGVLHLLDCWGDRFEDFARTGDFEYLVG